MRLAGGPGPESGGAAAGLLAAVLCVGGVRGGSYPFTWYRSAVATTTLIRRRRRSRVVLERNEARHGKQLRR